MPVEIIPRETATAVEIVRLREHLVAAREALSTRSKELNRLRAELKAFENRYFSEVGILYAELDSLEARIAEREVDLYDSEASRRRAAEARQQAEESREAASEHPTESPVFDPPASLRTLFREVAKRIHPDIARDDEEGIYFTLLMARANLAYRQGDIDALQHMLEDHNELHVVSTDASAGAELVRLTRQVKHITRDLAAILIEREAMQQSEIAQLRLDAEIAALAQRDLLGELAAALNDRITDARRRMELIDRQIAAHGR